MTRLLKLSDVAKILSVSPRTVNRWAKEGRINIIKLPKNTRRVSEEELTSFIARLNKEPLLSSTT